MGEHGTATWEDGETVKVTRRIRIPDSAPAGAYSLRVGVWEPRIEKHLYRREGWWSRSKDEMLLRLELSEDGSVHAEPSATA